MFFQQIPTVDASLSYFFGCATAAKAAAVDVVAGDEERFVAEANKAKVKIAYVIDTHVHADHYSGGRKLAQIVGAPYCLHHSNRANVRFDFEPLTDGQRLDLGNVQVTVLHTPGHTTDSISLLVTDLRRGNAPIRRRALRADLELRRHAERQRVRTDVQEQARRASLARSRPH